MRKNIFNIHTLPILALMIPIGLLSIITYHGDAMDIYRHTLIIPVLLKITMLMLVYVFGNELFLKSKYMDKT
jgi:hypothetical protein